MKRDTDDKTARGETERVWRRPTRRAFVAMLGAAAAAIALREKRKQADPPRSTWTGTTRWIGHC